MAIPYKIAVLAYVFNEAGHLLLLHRKKAPNRDLYSPIGGKLEQAIGESPYACCLREVHEEIGVQLTLDDIRLVGIVSERGYTSPAPSAPPPLTPVGTAQEAPGDATHWLMFCFEVTRPLNVVLREFDEGRLEWIDPIIMPQLTIPKTDRDVIWPLVQQHSRMLHTAKRKQDSFFSVHIDCSDAENFATTFEHPREGRAKEHP